MLNQSCYLNLADLVLITHFLFVLFVISGAPLVFWGAKQHWQWVQNPWYRYTHLSATLYVTIQSWLGYICPLTTLEMALRLAGKGQLYEGSFIQYWLQKILYFSAPEWVFVSLYTLFALLILLGWALHPPRKFGANQHSTT